MHLPASAPIPTEQHQIQGTSSAREILRLARPSHWVKNVLVLLPIVFARRVLDLRAWVEGGTALLAFCLAASAVYAMNDVWDRKADRLHPLKRYRPVASGSLSVGTALTVAMLCLAGALLIAFSLSAVMGVVIIAYALLQCAYTLDLKHRPIADVICLAMGFVLRAMGGAFAIRVEASPWLVVCTFTLCLFLGFCKRWNEIAAAGSSETALQCRKSLGAYKPEFLTHLVTLSASIAVVSYLLYAASPSTVAHFGTDGLLYTLPLVIYGICRFAMVSMQARYSDPVAVALRDKPLIATVFIWLLWVTLITTIGASLPPPVWVQP